MIFFDSLYVLIARFFLSIWNNYSNWWVSVRYGISLFYLMNIVAIMAFTGFKMSKIVFMSLVVVGYLFITFFRPLLNDKEHIEGFKLSNFWKVICLIYMSLSFLLLVYTFVYLVMD